MEITSVFPDEVVTKALVRDVSLPDGAGTMALITLDNGFDHTKPNSHGPAGLLELLHALDAGADVRVRERRRAGRRARGGAALQLPDDLVGRQRGGVPGVLPRAAARGR